VVSGTDTALHSKARPPSGELNVEAILTTHLILGEFGRDDRTFDILHADIFDSRPQVAVSALRALGTLADIRSFTHIARLFSHPDPEIVCAAVRTSGKIRAPKTLPFLLKLAAARREETVQLEVLRTLASTFPDSPDARQIASSLAHSPTVQPETRAASLEVLIQLESRDGAENALSLAVQEHGGLAPLLQIAKKDERLSQAVLASCRETHVRLPVPLRVKLIGLAAPLATEAARDIFLQSLADEDPGIRRECYRQLGSLPSQLTSFDALCALLAEAVEADPSLEEEALQAIDGMESIARASKSAPALPSLADLPARIAGLFDDLQKACERDIDTSHEMGMQIAKAKEYMEFNFDEEAKRTFLRSIKSGGSSVERQRSVQLLKRSAVKLEACHFEGYGILHELLADPTRSGIALFIRHLAVAKTEKRRILCRLKRALSILRLADFADMKELLGPLLDWARKMKLHRLAERALFALNRADPASALVACQDCMRPPVTNKMLAIAAIELIKDLDLAAMEPTLINLLHENDRYIRIALLDALSSARALRENLQRVILQLFSVESDREAASRLADLLGAKADVDIACAVIDVYDRFDEWKKILTVSFIHRIAHRCSPVRVPALTEFLYRVLRSGSPAVIARVPATLITLGDDYAVRVLSDVLSRLASTDRIMLVRDLRDELSPAVIAVVWSLLREHDKWLQETLRDVLPMTSDPRAQQLLVSMVRVLRMPAIDAEPAEVEPVDEQEVRFSTEKDTYRFEREHVRMCAVLFSDIQDYSSKSQELSPLEITTLLQEYEGILLPIVGAHEGALVKRMGDGHLFLFSEPLFAVLAAIRVQKALRRFNRFRPEKMRVVVRIGIHWGDVVEKGGDALGNTVNIASRLQTVARGGSTCISQEIFAKVSDWIHANDLGMIDVKGMREPIKAWEPMEIVLGIPADRDPLKRSRQPDAAAPTPAPTDVTIERAAVETFIRNLGQAFQRLHEVCRQSARTAEDASLIDEEFDRIWRELKPSFSSLGWPAREESAERPGE
jgi:class 3 adenylate cyclase